MTNINFYKGEIMSYDRNWAKVDAKDLPKMKVPAPGPKSQEIHQEQKNI